eukprot:4468033-Alexandrium_andersonii.AAC.1
MSDAGRIKARSGPAPSRDYRHHRLSPMTATMLASPNITGNRLACRCPGPSRQYGSQRDWGPSIARFGSRLDR